MNDDTLLRQLAETAREEDETEQRRLDPRWDALAAGTLEPEDEAALAAEAERSPEAAAAYDAFRPLDAAFRARVVKSLRPAEPGQEARAREAPIRKATARPFPEATSQRRPWRWPLRWLGAGAALAAASLLLVLLPGDETAPLPGYTASLAGGTETVRASPGGKPESQPPAYVPGNRFELLLRPETEVAGEVALRAFRLEGGTLTQWPELESLAEVASTGAVRVVATVGEDLALAPGETTLVLAVGSAGRLPEPDALAAELAGGAPLSEDDWRAFRLAFTFSPEP